MAFETQEQAWDRLTGKFGVRPIVRGTPFVGQVVDGTVVATGWGGTNGRAGAIIGIVAAIISVTVGALFMGDSPIIMALWCGVMGLVGLACLYSAVSFGRVTCRPWNHTLAIRWGLCFMPKKVELSAEGLTVELAVLGEEEGGPTSVGVCALRVRRLGDERPVIVATAREKTALEPAFGQLVDLLGGRSSDRTLADVPLGDGRSVCVSAAPFSTASANFRTSKLVRVSPDVVEIRPTTGSRILWGASLGVGLMGLAMTVGVIMSGPLFGALITGPVGVTFVTIALLGLSGRFGSVRVRADRTSRALTVGRGAAERRHPFDDLAALQVCSRAVANAKHPYVAFELNLILTDPPGERISLTCHANSEALQRDATDLAEFLGVPLLDHTGDGVGDADGTAEQEQE